MAGLLDEARRRSLEVIEGLKDRFGLVDLDIGDAGGHEHTWGTFREADVLEAALRTLDALREAHPEIVAAAIQRSLPLDLPVPRPRDQVRRVDWRAAQAERVEGTTMRARRPAPSPVKPTQTTR